MTLSDTRRELITLANRCDIPMLARRYRDLVTMLGRFETATGWIADNLRQSIARIIDEIGQIKRDGFYHNRLRELLSGPRNRTTV